MKQVHSVYINIGVRGFWGHTEQPGVPGQGVPGMNTDVAGFNNPGDTTIGQQGGPLGRAVNSIPGGNAIAHLHDNFQISIQYYISAAARNNFFVNVAGMAVATGYTAGTLLSNDWSILATKPKR